jgi:SanA protein
MLKSNISMFVAIVSILMLFSTICVLVPRFITGILSRSQITSMESAPTGKNVAIVFGAGLWRNGHPTPVLKDRVEAAVKLYFMGKIEKLLMSGDNSSINYNEPEAMKAYAVQLGVPEDAIVLDYAGRRTYDTCYRALHIFEIEAALLVTQSFHMPRAIYTCNVLGLEAIGVPSDLRIYRWASNFYWNLREIPATFVAMVELHLTKPIPIMGKPEPVFPKEAH